MASCKKISILAVGLIGGSLALALKKAKFSEQIFGWGHNEETLKTAQEIGAIDDYSTDLKTAVENSDIVFVATPTLVAGEILCDVLELVPTQTVVTDGASVKGNLLQAVQKRFGKPPSNLVLGHPIAGSEKSGILAANANLYQNHRVILTPTAETAPAAVTQITNMWDAAGAQAFQMTVEQHDVILALTSHLPHALAFTLVDTLAQQNSSDEIFRFAAGGFRDFTRIASSDPTMWHDIVIANRDAILKSIEQFSGQLDALRLAIEQKDSDTIIATFQNAKNTRDEFCE